jgi:hypothetical protein
LLLCEPLLARIEFHLLQAVLTTGFGDAKGSTRAANEKTFHHVLQLLSQALQHLRSGAIPSTHSASFVKLMLTDFSASSATQPSAAASSSSSSTSAASTSTAALPSADSKEQPPPSAVPENCVFIFLCRLASAQQKR